MVADHKRLMVEETWHLWISKVIEKINKNKTLQGLLYDTQEQFYKEEKLYRDFAVPEDQCYKIKQILDEILTEAIFDYCLCSILLDLYGNNKPTKEKWREASLKTWFSLTSQPYSNVSKCFLE